MIDYGIEDLSEESVSAVSAAAAQLSLLQRRREAIEQQLKDNAAAIRNIEEQELPNAMRAMGMEKFTLSNGDTITVREEVNAGIALKDLEAAFEWLRATGNDSLIKHTVSAVFGKGEDELATQCYELIAELAPDVELQDKASVHTSTLKSFVKERLALEKELKAAALPIDPKEVLPRELFGVYVINRAVVKRPKN